MIILLKLLENAPGEGNWNSWLALPCWLLLSCQPLYPHITLQKSGFSLLPAPSSSQSSPSHTMSPSQWMPGALSWLFHLLAQHCFWALHYFMTTLSVKVKPASWQGSVTLKCNFLSAKKIGLGSLLCTAEAGSNASRFNSSFSPSTHLLSMAFHRSPSIICMEILILFTCNYGICINCLHTIYGLKE